MKIPAWMIGLGIVAVLAYIKSRMAIRPVYGFNPEQMRALTPGTLPPQQGWAPPPVEPAEEMVWISRSEMYPGETVTADMVLVPKSQADEIRMRNANPGFNPEAIMEAFSGGNRGFNPGGMFTNA